MEKAGKSLDALCGSRAGFGEIVSVRQQQPLGLGHAVWCARHIVGDEPFAVLLPDDLMVGKPGALKQMVDAYAELGGNIVCAMEVAAEKTASYGIITPGQANGAATEVRGLVEKPRPDEAPSRLAVVGRYILQPEVMAILEQGKCGVGGEIQLTDGMSELIGRQPFHALKVDAVRHDCGNKAGFVLANLAIALDSAELAPQIEDYLAEPLASDDRREPAPFGFACFERGARFAEFDRSRHDPRIENGIVVTQFAHRARLGQPLRDPRQQHFEMERLGDDVVGARAKSVDRAGRIRAPGDEDHRNVLETGFVAHQPGQFDPAHRRHPQFGQQ